MFSNLFAGGILESHRRCSDATCKREELSSSDRAAAKAAAEAEFIEEQVLATAEEERQRPRKLPSARSARLKLVHIFLLPLRHATCAMQLPRLQQRRDPLRSGC